MTRTLPQSHLLLLWLVLLFAVTPITATTLENAVVREEDSDDDTGESSSTATSNDDTMIRVTLTFATPEDQDQFWETRRRHLSEENDEEHAPYAYQHGSSLALTVTPIELESLETDPTIQDITQDVRVYTSQLAEDTSHFIPYGVRYVQGTSTDIPLPEAKSNDCNSPNSFKVCVIDSGLLVDHRDIPFSSRSNPGIKGESFLNDPTARWDAPRSASWHGTHVTGTLLGDGTNNIGVRGVVSDAQGVCLLIARVFDERNFNFASVIIEAVEWCASNGAKVINMSLGATGDFSKADQQVYADLSNEGVLVVAAAGNSGTEEYNYPASLDSVISVAATDERNQRAGFSQRNDQIDLTAPGVNVMSTGSTMGFRLTALSTSLLQGTFLMFSPDVDEGQHVNTVLNLMNCDFGFERCENADGRICVIERGETFFWEKARNCQRGGGILALIYNNNEGSYGGTLGDDDSNGVNIPVLGLSREDGLLIVSNINSQATLQEAAPSYFESSGTSMASPHVAGVATRIWAARPSCTNVQIRQALEQSALDLGDTPGKDEEYGHGLVQAEAAYEYIKSQFDPPCGGADAPTCGGIYAACSSSLDCCSGRCSITLLGGGMMCRPVPKENKTKLGAEGRGGAAGAGAGPRQKRRSLIRGGGGGAEHGTAAAAAGSESRRFLEPQETVDVPEIGMSPNLTRGLAALK